MVEDLVYADMTPEAAEQHALHQQSGLSCKDLRLPDVDVHQPLDHEFDLTQEEDIATTQMALLNNEQSWYCFAFN